VTALVDLELAAGEGRVLRHELHFQFSPPAPAQVALEVPAALGDSLRVLSGGQLLGEVGKADKGGARTLRVQLTAPAGGAAPGKEHLLVLAYSFRAEQAGTGPVAVPLVVACDGPGSAVQGPTKVRVWSGPGAAPTVEGGAWAREDIEEVSGRDRLPSLVVRSGRAGAPLALRLGEGAPAHSVLVERALIGAAVGEAGVQTYRARYLLARLSARHVDVELPAPVSTLELRVRLDGRRVDWETVDEQGRRNDGGRTARLRLAPGLVRQRAVLEVSYRLPPGRSGGGPLQTTLRAPIVRDHPGEVPTRWQVDLPPGWVPLGPPEGAGPGDERSWGWRGWLLAPRPAASRADLEHWFLGPGREKITAGEVAGGDEPAPALVLWREGDGPVVLTHAPQQAWLLVCSLSLLALGLALSRLTGAGEGRARAAWAWLLLGLLAPAAVAGALLWPAMAAQVAYGCQPSALVLAVVWAAQLLLYERRRRQVIFLPSFSRARPGSTMQRPRDEVGPPGEPSTVDVVLPAGSSGGGRGKSPG
jgi:hypothetical protein